jgi:hypothetical protein
LRRVGYVDSPQLCFHILTGQAIVGLNAMPPIEGMWTSSIVRGVYHCNGALAALYARNHQVAQLKLRHEADAPPQTTVLRLRGAERLAPMC